MKGRLGQYEAAIADYDQALRLKPDYAIAYGNRGVANALLEQVNGARQDFKKALALAREAGDEDIAARAERGLALLGKPEDR